MDSSQKYNLRNPAVKRILQVGGGGGGRRLWNEWGFALFLTGWDGVADCAGLGDG